METTETENATSTKRRQLRLSYYNYNELNFDPERLRSSVLERLTDFQEFVKETCSTSEMQLLSRVNDRLKRFGYNMKINGLKAGPKDATVNAEVRSLYNSIEGTSSRVGLEGTSVFDPWDLMRS